MLSAVRLHDMYGIEHVANSKTRKREGEVVVLTCKENVKILEQFPF